MRLSRLKKLSSSDALDAYCVGRISRFEMNFSNYLRGEIDWPEYKPADVAALREDLGLTQEGMAVLLKVTPKTIQRWETEEGAISSTALIALCTLDKLRDEVFDLMAKDSRRFTLLQSVIREEEPAQSLDDAHPRRSNPPPPDAFDKEDVKTLQARLKLSRQAFADLLGVSLSTVEKWENGSVIPKGPALTVLKLLWTHGADVLR